MSSDGCTVVFSIPGRGIRRREVRAFARQVWERLARGRALTILVSDDAELTRLNRQFRGRDYVADVLSFPSSGTGGLGDIAVSADRARSQAAELGHSVEQEIAILILHGVLHLIGMDHEIDRGQMRRAETQWRRRFALPAGLIERGG